MGKERANKERANKERANKERANKERANKRRVHQHWWHGHWINGWDGRMNWSVGGTSFVSGFHSTHSNHREDRLFKPLLTRIGSHQSGSHWSNWVNNWDGYFAYSCPHNMAITGLMSFHDNRKEDRRWRIKCSRFHGL